MTEALVVESRPGLPGSVPAHRSPRAHGGRVAAYAALGVVAIFFIAPLVWLVLAAFEPNAARGVERTTCSFRSATSPRSSTGRRPSYR